MTDRDAPGVYEAERCLHVQGYPSRLVDGQAYYDDLVETRWFEGRWPWMLDLNIQVKESRHACAWSWFEKNTIYLPPWAQCDLTLLHEVAHFATWDVEHNVAFRQNYLLLVKHHMGPEAWRSLKYGFLAFGLDI